MRYLGNSEADREEIQVPDTEAQSGDIQKLESQNRMIFWAFLIVVLFLLVVIVILVLSRRKHLEHQEGEEDFDDFDDEEYAELEAENEQLTQEEEDTEEGWSTEDESEETSETDREDDADAIEEDGKDIEEGNDPDGWGDISNDFPGTRAEASKRYDRSTFKTDTLPQLDMESVLAEEMTRAFVEEADVMPDEKEESDSNPEETIEKMQIRKTMQNRFRMKFYRKRQWLKHLYQRKVHQKKSLKHLIMRKQNQMRRKTGKKKSLRRNRKNIIFLAKEKVF